MLKIRKNSTNILRNVGNDIPMYATSVKNILNESKIQFFQQIPICQMITGLSSVNMILWYVLKNLFDRTDPQNQITYANGHN